MQNDTHNGLSQILPYKTSTIIQTTNLSTRLSSRSLLIARWDRFPVGTNWYHLLSSCWHSFWQLQKWTSSFNSDWRFQPSLYHFSRRVQQLHQSLLKGLEQKHISESLMSFFLDVNPNGVTVWLKDHTHCQHST